MKIIQRIEKSLNVYRRYFRTNYRCVVLFNENPNKTYTKSNAQTEIFTKKYK